VKAGHVLKFAAALLMLTTAVPCSADTYSISQVLPTAKGTTVTLAGTAGGWKDSWKASAPNTFYLTDATGSIRVCIWPDDLAEVPPPAADGLKKKGTPIKLTGVVDLFRDKVELHIVDGSTIGLITGPSPANPAATPVSVPTVAPQPR
jgi:hypothetical protein